MTATLPASIANLTQPKKYLTCAETAKLVRTALKQAFPEIKFSIRSSNYAGGASISVRWVDGPKTAQVEAIAKRFAGASFDGSQDLKTLNTAAIDGQPVHFGADYVFCTREISDASREATMRVLAGMSLEDRESLICSLGLPYTRASDDLRSLARDVLYGMARPGFDGRTSALADTVADITAN